MTSKKPAILPEHREHLVSLILEKSSLEKKYRSIIQSRFTKPELMLRFFELVADSKPKFNDYVGFKVDSNVDVLLNTSSLNFVDYLSSSISEDLSDGLLKNTSLKYSFIQKGLSKFLPSLQKKIITDYFALSQAPDVCHRSFTTMRDTLVFNGKTNVAHIKDLYIIGIDKFEKTPHGIFLKEQNGLITDSDVEYFIENDISIDTSSYTCDGRFNISPGLGSVSVIDTHLPFSESTFYDIKSAPISTFTYFQNKSFDDLERLGLSPKAIIEIHDYIISNKLVGGKPYVKKN